MRPLEEVKVDIKGVKDKIKEVEVDIKDVKDKLSRAREEGRNNEADLLDLRLSVLFETRMHLFGILGVKGAYAYIR